MRKTCTRIALAAILVASGYYIAKHEQPIREVMCGVYNKTSAVIKAPFHRLYDWATDSKKVECVQLGELENITQDYQN